MKTILFQFFLLVWSSLIAGDAYETPAPRQKSLFEAFLSIDSSHRSFFTAITLNIALRSHYYETDPWICTRPDFWSLLGSADH